MDVHGCANKNIWGVQSCLWKCRDLIQAIVSEPGFLHVSYLFVGDRTTFCSIHWVRRSPTSQGVCSKVHKMIGRWLTRYLAPWEQRFSDSLCLTNVLLRTFRNWIVSRVFLNCLVPFLNTWNPTTAENTWPTFSETANRVSTTRAAIFETTKNETTPC